MKTILITGSHGFIGGKLGNDYFREYNTITLSRSDGLSSKKNIHVKGDITDHCFLEKVCDKYRPDFVIHCAGIAHQKTGSIELGEYLRVNSYASEALAKASAAANPETVFIFLSSISVYGEKNLICPVRENSRCKPSSDYACSKLDAEKRLARLFNKGCLKKLHMLRIAPVYDSTWTLNLDKRIFAFAKTAYIKFGSGNQRMSAVSISNLTDFIGFLVDKQHGFGQRHCGIYNICDEKPYSFKEIISTFKESTYQPDRFIIKMPLALLWVLVRISGFILKKKEGVAVLLP